MTKARTAALAALEAAHEPLSASGVFSRMGGSCDQATVYRALHYLEEKGHAESFVLSCREHGVERYYFSRTMPHRHWFHCESCHRFLDLGACRIQGLVGELEREMGMSVSRHTLYLTGTCASCASARGT